MVDATHELLILRHGKSDWPRGMEDFDRPLKKRGERVSDRIGRWVLDNGLVPDITVTSPANRALATARRVCQAMDVDPAAIREEDAVYLAGLETLLAIVRGLPGAARRAMIVGHNPGLEDLLAALADSDVPARDDGGRMPTCALAVLRFAKPWPETAPHTGSILNLIYPRELPSVA